jgi:hypothetical protein
MLLDHGQEKAGKVFQQGMFLCRESAGKRRAVDGKNIADTVFTGGQVQLSGGVVAGKAIRLFTIEQAARKIRVLLWCLILEKNILGEEERFCGMRIHDRVDAGAVHTNATYAGRAGFRNMTRSYSLLGNVRCVDRYFGKYQIVQQARKVAASSTGNHFANMRE